MDIFRDVHEVRERPTPAWLARFAPAHSEPLPDAADGLAVPSAWTTAIALFAHAPDVALLWRQASVSQPLQKVLAHVQKHNSAALRVRDIAAAAGMSATALSKAFRRAFGHSLKAHLTQDLLQRALQLLNGTNLTVRQISEELGYAQASYFERVFHKRFGLSPLKHRDNLHPRRTDRRLYTTMHPRNPPVDIAPRRRIGGRLPRGRNRPS